MHVQAPTYVAPKLSVDTISAPRLISASTIPCDGLVQQVLSQQTSSRDALITILDYNSRLQFQITILDY